MMNVINILLISMILFSCVRTPEKTGAIDSNRSNTYRFKNFVETIRLEQAVKELPNYMNFKKTFSLILVGKYDEESLKGVNISVKDKDNNNIVYNGQALGLYHLPKSRINIPINGPVNEVQVKLFYGQDDIRTKDYIIDKKNVLFLELEKF